MVTKEYLEKIGFIYNGEVKDQQRAFGQTYDEYIHQWSDCPPEAQCFDHEYGSYRIYTYSKYQTWEFFIIIKETRGGFAGSESSEIVYKGSIPDIKSLNFLMRLLKFKINLDK